MIEAECAYALVFVAYHHDDSGRMEVESAAGSNPNSATENRRDLLRYRRETDDLI